MIDVKAWDEPVDPFSGLIGMPPSIGCEQSILSADRGSYSGMHVFGNGATAAPPSLTEGEAVAPGAAHGKFDPLTAGKRGEDAAEFLSLSSSGHRSSLSHPARATPPRHHRDDPLLSRSRYRTFAPPRPPASRVPSGASPCMFSSVALSEATRTPLSSPGSWDRLTDRPGSSHGTDHASSGPRSLGPTSVTEGTLGSVPANAGPSTPSAEPELATGFADQDAAAPGAEDGKEEAHDGDERSHVSFSKEYHRPAPVHKVVAKEMKHIIGKVFPVGAPMVKAGRKLLGVSNSSEAAMQRSEGCLT